MTQPTQADGPIGAIQRSLVQLRKFVHSTHKIKITVARRRHALRHAESAQIDTAGTAIADRLAAAERLLGIKTTRAIQHHKYIMDEICSAASSMQQPASTQGLFKPIFDDLSEVMCILFMDEPEWDQNCEEDGLSSSSATSSTAEDDL